MDSEYQLRRRMNQRRNKPRHAIYGVAAGAEAFAASVASGMEGVVVSSNGLLDSQDAHARGRPSHSREQRQAAQLASSRVSARG
jgi:hypothetical protein